MLSISQLCTMSDFTPSAVITSRKHILVSGCIRRPTCWTSSQRVFSPMPKNSSMKGCSVRVLRFSGGTLAAYPDDESDRIDVCHGASPDAADEGVRVSHGDADDGLQARHPGRAALEKTQQRDDAGSCESRRRVRRWRDGEGSLNEASG